MKKQTLKVFLEHDFTKNILILTGGSLFAQALGFAVLPLLTRIYSASDMGILGLYTSIVGFFSVIAAFRYEVAIPMARCEKSSVGLIILSLILTIFSTMVVFLVCYLYKFPLATKLSGFYWLVPVGVFLAAFYSIVQFWATREKKFGQITQAKVTQSLFCSLIQVAMGVMQFGAVGLILGQIVNGFSGSLNIGLALYRKHHEVIKRVRIIELIALAKKYKKYPIFTMPESIVNSASDLVPMLLIASFVSASDLGYLVLAIKVMQAPIGLIGSAVSRVYYAHAVDKFKTGGLNIFTLRVLRWLSLIGFFIVLLLGMLVFNYSDFIFGDSWKRVGYVALWTIPWFFMQFVTSPLSFALYVTKNEKSAFNVQLLGMLIRVGCVILATLFYRGTYILEAYALSGFVFYLLYLFVILKSCRVCFCRYGKYD